MDAGPLLIILLAVVCSAFFSLAEMAFISANRLRIRHLAETGSRAARRFLSASERPEHFLSTAMMGVTIAHIVASTVATSWLLLRLGHLAPLVSTLVLVPLMLILGEVLPKAIAQQRATALALRTSGPLKVASLILIPFVAGSNLLVQGLLRITGYPPRTRRTLVSREELKLLLRLEDEASDVKEKEREVIDKIFDLGETEASEVMVPLIDVVALPGKATVEEALALIKERGYSRIPVYGERIDNVVGIVTAMDLLYRGHEVTHIRPLIRPVPYVPESKRIDDLLREFQRTRIQLAVVVDEYGGGVGIVTVEDILEEIVGEIADEHDRARAGVEPLPDGSYLVAARIGIDELNEQMEWDLPTGDYETLGGLILNLLSRIPLQGEQVPCGPYLFTIVEADARRVLKVKVAPPRVST